MTAELCSRGTRIEEEDFCHRTEKDVEFKCLDGLNAKLKKFYSWNKAIMVQIEIDGTIFCGCLYQDNNSFAPVKFGPPKRPPLPCIMPSKPKSPKRRKNTENSSSNAYSRKNWPRIYIDPCNTVEQRFRPGRGKNPSNNEWNTPQQISEEKLNRRHNKLGVLVYSNKKKSLCYNHNSKNSTENNSCFRRSKRLCNSFDELQRTDVVNGFKTSSNDKFSAFRFGHNSPKNNEDVVKSIAYTGKRRGRPRKISISSKPNLQPQRAKYGSKHEFVDSDSDEALSCSNDKFPIFRFGLASPKNNEKVVTSIGYTGKKRGRPRKTSISSKPNLQPLRAKYGSKHEFVNSDSDEALSSSNDKFPAFRFGHSNTKNNEDGEKSIIHTAKTRGRPRKTPISSKPNLRPRREYYGSKHEFVSSDSDEALSSSYDKFPSFRFGHASPKNNEDVVKSIGHTGKKSGRPRKSSILSKPNLRPRRAKYGSKHECVDSEEALSGSSDKFSEFRFGHASPKNNEKVVRNIEHTSKRRGRPRKISIASKPNLRPQRPKYDSKHEFVNSDEVLSSQSLVIDLTVSETDFDEIFHPTDIIDKSIEISETSTHQISQNHSLMNSEIKKGNKITAFDFDSQALNADKTIMSINNTKGETDGLPKSRSKKKRIKAVAKECSELADKFEKMTIRASAFSQPIMKVNPKREFDSLDVVGKGTLQDIWNINANSQHSDF